MWYTTVNLSDPCPTCGQVGCLMAIHRKEHMPMRCDQCNKFVGFEEADPEVEALDVNSDGYVSASVRICNTCAECGQEMTEATLDMEADAEVPDEHKGVDHELEVEEDGCERTSRSGYFTKGKFVPKSGRYGKTFYGVELSVTVKCSCGKWEDSITLSEEVQASGMDPLI